MPIEHINPGGLRRPPTYTHVVKATGGTTVYIAGQVSLDAGGNLVGEGDFAAQAKQVFENLRIALASAGAGFDDLARITTYIVGFDQSKREAFAAARLAAMGDALPASTLLGVEALALPGYQIEVEGIAVLD